MKDMSKRSVTNQKRRIHSDDWDWLIWLDGARWDYFVTLMSGYVTGTLTPVWNDDNTYTGDWAEEMLRHDFDNAGLFSSVDLSEFRDAEYDESNWFDVIPEYSDYHDVSVQDRLEALGYREQSGEVEMVSDQIVNSMVRDHLDEVDKGVIRYVGPHPPYTALEELTAGRGKIGRVEHAIDDGGITQDELTDAYYDEYRQSLKAAADIIPELDGTVVITADHGECLYDCGQVFHARGHEPHNHLTIVPWCEVREVVA